MSTNSGLTRSARVLACLSMAAIAASATALTDDEKKPPAGDVWPLNTCVVTGEPLGSMGDPIVYDHEGREVRFCCKGCIKAFEKDPKEYLVKADKQIIKQQMAFYPLDTCVVMEGEPLGSEDMGDPVNLVYKNRLVRFCCKGCVRKFKKDPADYLATIDKAVIKAQMKDYPVDYCIVEPSASIDGDDAVNFVFANRLVRLGSEHCVEEFKSNPVKYLAILDEAMKKD